MNDNYNTGHHELADTGKFGSMQQDLSDDKKGVLVANTGHRQVHSDSISVSKWHISYLWKGRFNANVGKNLPVETNGGQLKSMFSLC